MSVGRFFSSMLWALDLFCYWELVGTGITGPFVVSSIGGYDEEIGT